jgi:hypothetical protein
LVKAANLRHYIGRYLAAPGIVANLFACDDRLTDDQEDAEGIPLMIN